MCSSDLPKKEFKVLEPKGRKVLELMESVKVGVLRKDYGFTPIPIYNKETKGITYEFEKQPSWFKGLRPGFQTKTQQETYVPFWLRKLRYGVGEAAEDIFQKTTYQGPPPWNFKTKVKISERNL